MHNMGVKWTEEQQLVIEKRNANILVAAAAGSGKTAVLVERIITRLTQDAEPINVDELLIVTFTEAAAAEMKERILAAIEKALEERPNDPHLQKQATLIHGAFITTIHSFCLSVIREHFHTIDLDPVFRIGEEGELKLIKQEVMNQLLEEEYQNRRPEFVRFVECMAPGRSDRKIEEIILNIYEFSRSNPQANIWLDQCVAKYDMQSEEELVASSIAQYLIQMIVMGIEELLIRTEQAMFICRESGGPHHYEEALMCDKESFEAMLEDISDSTSEINQMDRVYNQLHRHEWEPLSRKRPKDVDKDMKEIVQSIRTKNKKVMESWKSTFIFGKAEEHLEALHINYGIIHELVHLVKKFASLYEEEKQGRGMIDFNDMEQYALRILTEEQDGEMIASKVAQEYQEKFAEVMIDEYQDSNLVQEAILTSVSKVSQGIYNIFMVGDVKQSIYRFRLSRPELFMEKFNTYQVNGVPECRIDLNKNFRSREEVLDTTNYVFYQIMKSCLGGVQYDANSALYCGAVFPELPELKEGQVADNTTELLLLDDKEVKEARKSENKEEQVEENSRELEARMVARRIKELVNHHLVLDKETGGYRTAKYRDIVILSRSLSGWSDVFSKGLNEEGVPTSVENREGYFTTQEIALLLDYLRVLDNPKQDIPLTAVLRSVFGNISDDELAAIKCQNKKSPFCEAVYKYANVESVEIEEKAEFGETPEGILKKKLRDCIMKIEEFRKKIAYMGIHELLWEILQETHYREYIYALPGGEQRRANVDMLLEKATAFEKTSYKGIFNFIRYIEQLEKYNVEYGEANMVDELEDAVRIMSIHKSKGLEFPIVFIIGMGKLFNKRDQTDDIVMHLEEGLGVNTISEVKRTKYQSLMKQVIKKRLDEESLGEELRVLYVAMTRAKEKLIMTGKIGDANATLEKQKIMRSLPIDLNQRGFIELVSARSYMDWVLPSVYLHPDAKTTVRVVELKSLVREELEEELAGEMNRMMLEQFDNETIYKEEFKPELEAQLDFQYDFIDEQDIKLKISVTELKRRMALFEKLKELSDEEIVTLEDVEEKKQLVSFVELEPEFIKKKRHKEEVKQEKSGAFRGTAYHRFLELWDFSKEYSDELLAQTLTDFVNQKKMSEEMISYIESSVVKEFLDSPIANRMKVATRAGCFYKEQPFVLGVKAVEVYGIECEETVLVQGIIDVYFEEEDGLVLLDYKTDKIKSLKTLVENYHTQLDYYAKALEQLTGKTVKEKIIYSLALQKQISI